ncbi:peroxisomal membrane protein PEX14 [Aspergillus clavatus NRRL 1]|uniref:Peroxisomal membrane protein PEX14 n=1 Tax=Aspergillus clavatus (strain ATCC 1007 / CBS 513.65 / DSM 816 / NCTC 3887 / NRRL 1 / QM 1276 / 107) TaxID=344612 RepID=A1C6X4_ASPCL|nr:peroxisomal membrane anchor protein, putative [Aspergillus clavatus NRRL 1]EAW14145.1 peroxisomal membrane anchor protein, putative [Aspergillus clavatus NRRL 1]
MSNVKPKAPSIPQWQQPAAANSSDASTSTPSPNSDETPRSELLEQAAKFLQDDSIRNAPIDRKVSFLESKGLQSEEIDQLLGVIRNAEASTSASNTAKEEGKSTPDPTSSEEKSKASTPATPSSVSQRPKVSSSPSSAPAASTTSKTSAPREVPPIITYPEFLVQQSKPPPLVTLRSTLYTLYGAAGLGAGLYGASEYLIKPMLATLTSARLDLAQTTTTNLTKLNERLEQTVSRIPPELTTPKPQPTDSALSDEDTDSITSDPTELFHRDVATQTSQDFAASSPSSLSAGKTAAGDDSTIPDPTATVTTHHKRLETITSQLRDFDSTEKDSDLLGGSMRSSLNELQHYLDGLQYSRSSYAPSTGYGVYSTVSTDTSAGSSAGITKAEEDAISSFRAEIRGVKGALLSARNFPASRGRVAGIAGR